MAHLHRKLRDLAIGDNYFFRVSLKNPAEIEVSVGGYESIFSAAELATWANPSSKKDLAAKLDATDAALAEAVIVAGMTSNTFHDFAKRAYAKYLVAQESLARHG